MSADRDRVAAALTAYDVGEEIGRGAWGIVLEGRHRRLGRQVAIKQLPVAFSADPAIRERFFAESRALASLDHPHIVSVYDYVEQDGLCILVMERLTGGTVWGRLTGAGLTMQSACAVALAACDALDYAHHRDILHRDIKPENLLFTASGMLKVTDFGFAKMVGGAGTVAASAGEVLGTPAYMAPEQALGRPLSPATDVYALGVTLYELLSGRLPFSDQGDPLAVLYRHVHEQAETLATAAPNVAPPVATATMRALATAPEDRYRSAHAFGVALTEAAIEAWGAGWLTQDEFSVPGIGATHTVTDGGNRDRSEPARLGISHPKTSTTSPSRFVRRVDPPPHAQRSPARSDQGSREESDREPEERSLETVPLGEMATPAPAKTPSYEGRRSLAPQLTGNDGADGSRLEAEAERNLAAASHELAKLRLVRLVSSQQVRFSPAETDEVVRLTSAGESSTRCGCNPQASAREVRAAALGGVERWRERAASPIDDPTTTEACEIVAHCYEEIWAAMTDRPGS